MTGSKHGFTKMELLAVIGILAVLASLLLPALSGAKKKSRQVICLSNLRELGLAVAMYSDDFLARPGGMQILADAWYVPVPSVLRCADDAGGNWGGDYQEMTRQAIAPGEAPERVRYSYIHNLSWDQWLVADLLKSGNSAGLAVCQLHGANAGPGRSSIARFEGLVLRLQHDGAVVRRRNIWPRQAAVIVADPWSFFSDEPHPISVAHAQ